MMKFLSWKPCVHPKHPGRVGKWNGPIRAPATPRMAGRGQASSTQSPSRSRGSTTTLSGSQSFEAGGRKRALRICVGCGSRPAIIQVRGSQLPSRPAKC